METLDKYDIAILHELQADGRLTNAELAQRVGLSAAPCWRRVRALEDGGFIVGYRAEINRRKIGLGVLAFVRLFAERNAANSIRELGQAIAALPLGYPGLRAGRAQPAAKAIAQRPSRRR